MSRDKSHLVVLLGLLLIMATVVILTANVFVRPAMALVEPVDSSVVDRFRAPAHAFGAGNRGWEYDARPGQPVRVIESGVVTVAGRIGANDVVVVDHGGGLRSTLMGLQGTVRAGDKVEAGFVVGTVSSNRLYMGLRCGDRYVDPALLFGGSVRLVDPLATKPSMTPFDIALFCQRVDERAHARRNPLVDEWLRARVVEPYSPMPKGEQSKSTIRASLMETFSDFVSATVASLRSR